ncbi:MAG: alpha-ketoacid dehydrogenase subunit beta [Actinomycetota bacterium]
MNGPTLIEGARGALTHALESDPRVVVLGEDVAAGGPFGLTKDLVTTFGAERVRNTPISEGAVMGAAVGLALGGRRPFVDLMFVDFVTAASDQLFNHAAKIHYMSGGHAAVPLAVWTIGGAGTRWGAQHSQRLDGWLAQVPGLKVLAPASPAAAAAAVQAALDDPDPVVMIADRSLLYSRAGLPADGGSPWKARLVQRGTELTVAATGRLVHLALEAAGTSGASVEVIDLQRLAPLDVEPVLDSVTRTAKLLVLHDEAASGSVATGISAAVAEQAFWLLDAPVRRLTSPPTPVPAAATLEDDYMLGVDDIALAMKELIDT